ncbi:MAG: 16S rRNA (guanine(966)-N(2))-methyltransferase RsmD [Saprospiraceae bacterium]
MRIISGKFKGRKIRAQLKNNVTRPTMDMAKEGLFNILDHRYDLEEIKTLELFGGTGSISLEFISRGVMDATIVERDYKCFVYIKQLSNEFNIENELKIKKYDVIKFLESDTEKYDIIFADPPYNYPNMEKIIDIIYNKNLLKPEGIIIFEHDNKNDFSEHPKYINSKKYGTSIFSFFQ